jgi:hypothetical chaperone protein
MSQPLAYGIDFGTSNCSIAVAVDGGSEIGVVNTRGDTVMPSIVYVDATRNRLAGLDAVDNYIRFAADASRARLMSSLKSFLTDRSFKYTTAAWGERYTMPELVAIILRQLKRVNDQRLGADVKRVVLGHPVLFAGASGPDFERLQEHALEQLAEAARLAGFNEVVFLDEPTAALIGESMEDGILMALDFGGGTFDVSIIEFTPAGGDVLALHGAAIGGELFDSLLFDAKVASVLHLDDEILVNGKRLHIPVQLRHMRTLHEIVAMVGDDGVRKAFEFVRQSGGEPLATAEEIIYGGHGYNFFRAIEAAKIELSDALKADIAFRRPRVALSVPVRRAEFDALIQRNLDRIDDQITRALDDAGIDAAQVDLVVRTGGSSRIPAFVERLSRRFGTRKLAERDAFTTVALGLGYQAFETWR